MTAARKLFRLASAGRLATYLIALWKLARHADTPRLHGAVRLEGVTTGWHATRVGLLLQRNHTPVCERIGPAQQPRRLLAPRIQRRDPWSQLVEFQTGQLRGLDDAHTGLGPAENRRAGATQLGAALAIDGVGHEDVIDQRRRV